MNEHRKASHRRADSGTVKKQHLDGVGGRQRDARLSRARILVVAEDDDTRELLGIVLRHAGGVPLLASNTAGAVELLEGFKPNVMVSDLPFEAGWGARFLCAVRATSRTPIAAVAISANATERGRKSALDAGFDSYLVKPLTTSDLVDAVASGLASRRIAALAHRRAMDPAVHRKALP